VLRKNKVGADIEIPALKTAIEVELGTSNIEWNIHRNLQESNRVLVCSDDKMVLDRVRDLCRRKERRNVFVCQISEAPELFASDLN